MSSSVLHGPRGRAAVGSRRRSSGRLERQTACIQLNELGGLRGLGCTNPSHAPSVPVNNTRHVCITRTNNKFEEQTAESVSFSKT